jgi:hypothetical protein
MGEVAVTVAFTISHQVPGMVYFAVSSPASRMSRADFGSRSPSLCDLRLLTGGFSLGCALVLAGCDGVQSALEPAGSGAARIAELFWWLVGGAVLI